MLRNHHANPPTRIPETARMCMPGPGLVVSCAYVISPGLSETTILSYSLPIGCGVEIPCDMVIEK